MKFQTTRWIIFSILILTYILVYFHRMAPGVVSDYLMTEFDTTGTRLGALSAIYFFVYAAMQLPSGVLADTLGTRASVVGGNITAGLGSFIFGMATSFEMACGGRFLVGLGVSVVFISIMKNNAVWFHARIFGLMSGVTLLIGNLGAVTAAAPLSSLLSLFTWRTIFISIGGFSLLLAVAAFFIIRNRPEDLGFDPPNPPAPIEERGDTHDSWFKNLTGVVKTLRVWPGFWVQFGSIGSTYSFMGLWGIPYLRNVYSLSRSEAAAHMTIMLLSFAVGALFFGWFSDRLRKRKLPLIFGMALHVLAWTFLIFGNFSPGTAGKFLLGLMGFGASSFVITFASAKELIDPDLSGMAVGIVNTGSFIGTALMQPLFGWLADRTWDGTLVEGARLYRSTDYHTGLLLMLAFAILGLVGTFFVRETGCKNIAFQQSS